LGQSVANQDSRKGQFAIRQLPFFCWRASLNKEFQMLLCAKANAEDPVPQIVIPETADTGKMRLGGAYRLPVRTADTGKIVLGGACRLPMKTADIGKIRPGEA
jgi:hypothetical protein